MLDVCGRTLRFAVYLRFNHFSYCSQSLFSQIVDLFLCHPGNPDKANFAELGILCRCDHIAKINRRSLDIPLQPRHITFTQLENRRDARDPFPRGTPASHIRPVFSGSLDGNSRRTSRTKSALTTLGT